MALRLMVFKRIDKLFLSFFSQLPGRYLGQNHYNKSKVNTYRLEYINNETPPTKEDL